MHILLERGLAITAIQRVDAKRTAFVLKSVFKSFQHTRPKTACTLILPPSTPFMSFVGRENGTDTKNGCREATPSTVQVYFSNTATINSVKRKVNLLSHDKKQSCGRISIK